jgi:polyisoprenoid-binding protein YceI
VLVSLLRLQTVNIKAMTTGNRTLPLASGRWAVVHNHSSIGFSVPHLGVSKVRGRIPDV